MQPAPSRHPPLALMHLSFLFSGAGTLLLGPTLPLFAQQWHLHDSQSGLLIAAQFFGLFTGAMAVGNNLRLTLLFGDLTAAMGFGVLALALRHTGGSLYGVFAFYLLGLGLGQITTSVNLLSALRYQAPQKRSSALSLLNFTWSAGAVLSPLLAAAFLGHASLTALLLTFATLGAILMAIVAATLPPTIKPAETASPRRTSGIAIPPLLYFCAIFFLYGGFEATLGGWLSTYTLRYTALNVVAAAYCTTALWASFAIGRAIAAALLRVVPDTLVRNAGVLLAVMATVALRLVHTGIGIGVCASVIGLGIAPFFPVVFSALIARAPTPRQAGAAAANIALGSAVFPYITGLTSTLFGSLHTAMLTPIVIAISILLFCAFDRPSPSASLTAA